MKKRFAVFIIAGLLVSACDTFQSDNDSGEAARTPYADLKTLEEISAREGFVDWKVARFFALNKLDDSRRSNSWDGSWLSERPLVIYNEETGAPRYYEFRIIRMGEEVGAVSCVADKSDGPPVQYVLPFARTVSWSSFRALSNGMAKLTDLGYPARLRMKNGIIGRTLNPETGEEDSGEYPKSVKGVDFLSSATAEQLEMLGITGAEMYERLLAAEKEKVTELADLWKQIDGLQEKILAMTEEELLEAFGDKISAARLHFYDETDEYMLPDWYNKRTWFNYGGYCGPNVVAFVMLGLGRNSGYRNIPTVDSEYLLRPYYQTIENHIGSGAKTWNCLDQALYGFTGGRYGMDIHWSELVASHSWGTINSEVRKNGLPVVSLRWPHITTLNRGFHYRTVIGTKRTASYLEQKILWWTASLNYWNKYEYYMHDNGIDGDKNNGWWEGDSLYHFQAASVVKR